MVLGADPRECSRGAGDGHPQSSQVQSHRHALQLPGLRSSFPVSGRVAHELWEPLRGLVGRHRHSWPRGGGQGRRRRSVLLTKGCHVDLYSPRRATWTKCVVVFFCVSVLRVFCRSGGLASKIAFLLLTSHVFSVNIDAMPFIAILS